MRKWIEEDVQIRGRQWRELEKELLQAQEGRQLDDWGHVQVKTQDGDCS